MRPQQRADRGLLLVALVVLGALSAAAQSRSSIVIGDTLVFPESLTSSADGTVWIGSSSKAAVFRAAPNASRAELWIPAGTAGLKRVLGVFADEPSRTLWVCSAAVAPPDPAPVATSVKAFDIATGTFKQSYPFAGGGSCNDMARGSGGTLYATDIGTGRIMRLTPGAAEFEPWSADPQLASADGITVLADGAVYVSTLRTGFLLRIPVGADGTAGSVVKLETSRPLVRPDGMRAVGPHTILLAEGEGRLVEVNVQGTRAEVRVLKEGMLGGPAAVTLAGDVAFVLESKFNYLRDPLLSGKDPGIFEAIAVPYAATR